MPSIYLNTTAQPGLQSNQCLIMINSKLLTSCATSRLASKAGSHTAKISLLGWASLPFPDQLLAANYPSFTLVFILSTKGLVALEPFFYAHDNITQEEQHQHYQQQLKALQQAQIPPLDKATAQTWVQKISSALTQDQTTAIPLDLRGTSFQQAVWSALQQIPKGTTRTYAQLAAQLNNPKASRAVGSACGANPLPFIIPCHRVLASNGGLGGFAFGLTMKQALLTAEAKSSQI